MAQPPLSAPNRPLLRFWRLASLFIGLSLLAYGGLSLINRQRALSPAKPPASDSVVEYTTDQPAESAIDEKSYTTKPDQPRRIIIADIGLTALIQPVGVDQNNAIAAPNNVRLAGWFTDSPKPGKAGVSIIDGHVQGRYTDGAFKNLSKVKPGQAVTVDYGDGSKRDFTIVSSEVISEAQASKAQYRQLPNVTNQLTLITCAGKYDSGSGKYLDRSLVYASANPE